MTRYQVLRAIGCDWFSAKVISALNTLVGAPPNYVGFMHIDIWFDPEEEYDPAERYELTPRNDLV